MTKYKRRVSVIDPKHEYFGLWVKEDSNTQQDISKFRLLWNACPLGRIMVTER
jgi:hypothetical protein